MDKNINLNQINIDENSNREIIKKYDSNWAANSGYNNESSNNIHNNNDKASL